MEDIVFEDLGKGHYGFSFNGNYYSARVGEEKSLEDCKTLEVLKGKPYVELSNLYEATGDKKYLRALRIAAIKDRDLLKGDLVHRLIQAELKNGALALNRYTGGRRTGLSDREIKQILKHKGNVSKFCKRYDICKSTYMKVKNQTFKNDLDNERVKNIKAKCKIK